MLLKKTSWPLNIITPYVLTFLHKLGDNGGAILGGTAFIKEVLQRLNDQSLRTKETFHRRALGSRVLDIDEIVQLLSRRFKVSEEAVKTTSPYKTYAVYLTRKPTSF